MGRLAPDMITMDAVIPRTRLPEVLVAIDRMSERYGLGVANVFHAGDGNLHPNISFDGRDPDQVRRVAAASKEILELCVGVGGSITGEHGVGMDKMESMKLIFSDADLEKMLLVREVFNPFGLCNPGKVLPTTKTCRYCGFGIEDVRHTALTPHGRSDA